MKSILPDNVYQLAFYESIYKSNQKKNEVEIKVGKSFKFDKRTTLGDIYEKLPQNKQAKLGYYLGAASNSPYTVEFREKGNIKKGYFAFLKDKGDAAEFFKRYGAEYKGYKSKGGIFQTIKEPTRTSISLSYDGKSLIGTNPKTKNEVLLSNKFEPQFIKFMKIKGRTGNKVVVKLDKTLMFGEPKKKETKPILEIKEPKETILKNEEPKITEEIIKELNKEQENKIEYIDVKKEVDKELKGTSTIGNLTEEKTEPEKMINIKSRLRATQKTELEYEKAIARKEKK